MCRDWEAGGGGGVDVVARIWARWEGAGIVRCRLKLIASS